MLPVERFPWKKKKPGIEILSDEGYQKGGQPKTGTREDACVFA